MRMRLTWTGAVALGLASVFSASGCASKEGATGSRSASGERPRIGVYDSRAIAVAWAASKYNTRAQELMAAYEKAKAAGDEARMKELKRQGSAGQDKLHAQGFGRAPVDDLLEPIGDRIPEILSSAGVERMESIWSPRGRGVATVDLTDQLLQAYDPSPKTLKTVAELRKHKPIDPPYHHH